MLEALVARIMDFTVWFEIEIIVVEETDSPRPIAGVVYTSHPVRNRGIGYARNLALKHAKGSILVFVDDDCRIPRGWLETLVKPLIENMTVVGVQGGVTVPSTANAIGWAETLLGFPGGGLKRIIESCGIEQPTRNISTLNCAYAADVLVKIGGFNETLVSGSEDYLLGQMASERGACLFHPSAFVEHEPRGSLRKIWQWFRVRGRADIELVRTNQLSDFNHSYLMKSSLSAKLFVYAGVCCAAAVLAPQLGAILFLGGLAGYYGCQIARFYRVWLSSGCRRNVLFLMPVVKAAMDIATDYGRIQRLVHE
jgi:GT2 family glycosyltransferase